MAPEDELPRAVRALHQGRHYYAGSVAKLLAAQWTGSAIRPPHEHLSERELQVFFGLAKGETLSQVAQRMCLSIKTVSTYRSRLIAKLKVQTNSELTYYALKEGLIE
jgi:DNA-binding NarL/FixJ family response regulator